MFQISMLCDNFGSLITRLQKKYEFEMVKCYFLESIYLLTLFVNKFIKVIFTCKIESNKTYHI